MTGSNEQPSKCPACDTDSLSYQEHIESWLCNECSYVVDSNSLLTETGDTSDSVDDALELKESEPVNWESQIAVRDKSEANLVDALSQTEAICDALSLPEEQVIRSAKLIAKAWETNFMHGRSLERTIGAVIYAVSREADNAFPPAMIAEVMETDKGSIKQMFQKLNRELNLEIGPPTPKQFTAVICIELNLPRKVEVTARDLLDQGESKGGNPVGVAAAAVYIACDQTDTIMTLKEIAQLIGLTKETVWRRKSEFEVED